MRLTKYKGWVFFGALVASAYVGYALLVELHFQPDFKYLPKPKIVKNLDWNGRNLSVSVRKIEGHTTDPGKLTYDIFVEVELSKLLDEDNYFYTSCVLLETSDGNLGFTLIDSEKSKSKMILGNHGRPIHSGSRDWRNLKFMTNVNSSEDFHDVVNAFDNHFTIKLDENCPLVADVPDIEY